MFVNDIINRSTAAARRNHHQVSRLRLGRGDMPPDVLGPFFLGMCVCLSLSPHHRTKQLAINTTPHHTHNEFLENTRSLLSGVVCVRVYVCVCVGVCFLDTHDKTTNDRRIIANQQQAADYHKLSPRLHGLTTFVPEKLRPLGILWFISALLCHFHRPPTKAVKS